MTEPLPDRSSVFAVKVRSQRTRSWGDLTEVMAVSAKVAAEQLVGSPLREGPGDRADLRARVWPTPFGTSPDIPFFTDTGLSSPGPGGR